MTTRMPFICVGCKRFKRDGDYNDIPSCDAFPDGIPPDITAGLDDHTEFREGDHGLKFVEDPERAEVVNLYYDWINSPEGGVWKQWAVDMMEEANQSGQTGDQHSGGGTPVVEA